MRGLTDAEIPKLRDVFARDWPTVAPLLALIVVLFTGYTPYLSAFWGITGCMLLTLAANRATASVVFAVTLCSAALTGILREQFNIGPVEISVNLVLLAIAVGLMAHGLLTRKDGREQANELADAFIMGAKYAIGVGAAAATVGIIVGVVTLTGAGFKISYIVTSLADTMAQGTLGILPFLPFDMKSATLFYTLILTAIVCILLGCGVPTTATYIIMVTVAAPTLGMLGVAPLVAHFFVFYYGVLADVTPPVAIAAYAGASMAGADPFKTGNTAFRLALGKVMVPFVFVFSPSMLIMVQDFTLSAFFASVVGCILSITALSAVFTHYALAPLRWWDSVLLCIAAVPMIGATWSGIAIGLVIAVPVIARQMIAARN
jgi:TRAP transporter 4TM/12TM fusion protein